MVRHSPSFSTSPAASLPISRLPQPLPDSLPCAVLSRAARQRGWGGGSTLPANPTASPSARFHRAWLCIPVRAASRFWRRQAPSGPWPDAAFARPDAAPFFPRVFSPRSVTHYPKITPFTEKSSQKRPPAILHHPSPSFTICHNPSPLCHLPSAKPTGTLIRAIRVPNASSPSIPAPRCVRGVTPSPAHCLLPTAHCPLPAANRPRAIIRTASPLRQDQNRSWMTHSSA
jgi:hypothetical protein